MAFKARGSSDFKLFFSLGDFSNCRVKYRSSCKNGLLSIFFLQKLTDFCKLKFKRRNKLFIPEPQWDNWKGLAAILLSPFNNMNNIDINDGPPPTWTVVWRKATAKSMGFHCGRLLTSNWSWLIPWNNNINKNLTRDWSTIDQQGRRNLEKCKPWAYRCRFAWVRPSVLGEVHWWI